MRVHAGAPGEAAPEAGDEATPSKVVSYAKILVCLMDESPYLSQGSRETVAAAAQLASAFKGHLVVVSLDRVGWSFDGSVRADTIAWHLKENNCDEYDMVVNKVAEGEDVAIGIADLADDIEGTFVVLSTDIVEEEYLDANKLAKFIGCSFAFIE
eukprot:CAMPEP_0118934690 /NCGR_PEP_ID=MMETSP1169-20130426/13963_1 /TAXON_ID=36882 /ORGANISM="Pyramimonas obovata, Strain CCMP722" /LENGTH=154 /DNA_ID=CAMNT_0006877619 /DNA_START=265 /DNA_END=729 /DNA_ORIENTATION=+